MWFKAAGSTASGVLFSYDADQLSNSSGNTDHHDPALYVGGNGQLYGELWNGSIDPIHTSASVDDGNWHYVVLSGSSTSQSLYLDGSLVGTLSGQINQQNMTVDTVGAGFWQGGWPNAYITVGPTITDPAIGYYNGDIGQVAVYPHALGLPAVVAHDGLAGAASPELTQVTLPYRQRRPAGVLRQRHRPPGQLHRPQRRPVDDQQPGRHRVQGHLGQPRRGGPLRDRDRPGRPERGVRLRRPRRWAARVVQQRDRPAPDIRIRRGRVPGLGDRRGRQPGLPHQRHPWQHAHPHVVSGRARVPARRRHRIGPGLRRIHRLQPYLHHQWLALHHVLQLLLQRGQPAGPAQRRDHRGARWPVGVGDQQHVPDLVLLQRGRAAHLGDHARHQRLPERPDHQLHLLGRHRDRVRRWHDPGRAAAHADDPRRRADQLRLLCQRRPREGYRTSRALHRVRLRRTGPGAGQHRHHHKLPLRPDHFLRLQRRQPADHGELSRCHQPGHRTSRTRCRTPMPTTRTGTC